MNSCRSWRYTKRVCYLGYVVQAVINNYAALLFLTFQKEYQLSIEQVGLLAAVNFGTQLLTDFLSARFIDVIGYRASMLLAHGFAVFGLAGFTWLPESAPVPFAGLALAMACGAVGGGLIEVIISPIVDACSSGQGSGQMSLLHSFYCWGFAGVVLVSSIFFRLAGIRCWKQLALLWAVIPFINGIFCLFVPFPATSGSSAHWSIRRLCSQRLFWMLLLLMLCSGAAEQAVSQWISAFTESGLHLSKSVGDLVGPLCFAVLMGISRAVFGVMGDRVNLRKGMEACGGLCVAGYLLASLSPSAVPALLGCALCGLTVGVMWPGVLGIAARSPLAGTALFSMLAFAGDLGAVCGPALVGTAAGVAGDSIRIGLLVASIFPLCLTTLLISLRRAAF